MMQDRRILRKLPLPRIVCDECGHLCVWERYEGMPLRGSWLKCEGCGKKWSNFDSGIERQDEMMDDVIHTVRDVTHAATDVDWYSELRQRLCQQLRPARASRASRAGREV